MPFTLAHPAAVIPLLRRPFDGLALVCGAMAPDVAYFIRATPIEVTAESWYEPFTNATTTHSPAGLVPVTLLLGMGLYLVLRPAERPLRWLRTGRWDAPAAPPAAAEGDRAGRSSFGIVIGFAGVVASLLLGSLTHVVWDSLTSSDGPPARNVDGLHEIAVADVSWIRLSQHVSTVVGLVLIGIFLWRRRDRFLGRDASARRRLTRALLGLMTLATTAGVGSVLARFDSSESISGRDRIEILGTIAVKGAGVAVMAALVLATVAWWSVRCLAGRTGAIPSPE